MNIEFITPEIKTGLEWQLYQNINVFDGDNLVAKAELEIITLNKHRDAIKSYQALLEIGSTDWEIPLNLFFKHHNLNNLLCDKFAIKPESKKSTQHIIIEAISVAPNYQGNGIAKMLLKKIATKYVKVQSLWALSMPLSEFLDTDACDEPADKAYYQCLSLGNHHSKENISQFFEKLSFERLHIDKSLLAEPLPFDLFVISPKQLGELN